MDKKIVTDRNILLFAFRYALGRMSYAPGMVIDSIKENIENISSNDIEQYIREIEGCNDYGMAFDKTTWLNFCEYLKHELRLRTEYSI